MLGGPGYALLTTPERGRGDAPEVVEAAGAVYEVGARPVDELAGELLGTVRERPHRRARRRPRDRHREGARGRLGRHRARDGDPDDALRRGDDAASTASAAGAPEGTPASARAVVVNDPALSASQPEPELAASALNALGHAAEGPCTPRANPVATLAALEAARLLAGAFRRAGQPDRDALALGALLAGYTIDSTVYGLHHVLSQTLVRLAGVGHGPANAIMLPAHARRARLALPRLVAARSARPRAATRRARRAAVRAHRRDPLRAVRASTWRRPRPLRRRRGRARRARPDAAARGPRELRALYGDASARRAER